MTNSIPAADVTYVIAELWQCGYTAEEAQSWLNASHPQLNNKSPLDVIAEGRTAEVMAIIRRLQSDAYL